MYAAGNICFQAGYLSVLNGKVFLSRKQHFGLWTKAEYVQAARFEELAVQDTQNQYGKIITITTYLWQ